MNIVKKVNLGKTHMGRDIIALKVTSNAKTRTDGTRPAVLYNAMQHAREWLAGETCRRTLLYFTSNYGKNTPDGQIVTELVNSRELWFECVNNPDGYEYTFTPGNRLWRKNMADNNGNGIRGEAVDGVDPNRNHAIALGLRQRGVLGRRLCRRPTAAPARTPSPRRRRSRSSGAWSTSRSRRTTTPRPSCCCGRTASSSTRRRPTTSSSRPTPATTPTRRSPTRSSTPETEEWEITGNRFDPDIGAELYITNGDLTDDAYEQGILAYTPEGSDAQHPERLGLRVPGRRGRHRGRVPAPQAVRARPRPLGRRSGEPDLAHGQHGRELLRRDVRRLLRRPADRAGRGQEVARRRQAALPHQRRLREDGQHVRVPRRRALRQGARPLLPPPPRHRDGHEPG